MAWSYRRDRTDELYADEAGVHQVSGEKLPHTPRDPDHGEDMLKKPKPVKGVVTQHQEHANQNVPRVIEDEGDTLKDKERVEQAEKDAKEQKERKPARKKTAKKKPATTLPGAKTPAGRKKEELV